MSADDNSHRDDEARRGRGVRALLLLGISMLLFGVTFHRDLLEEYDGVARDFAARMSTVPASDSIMLVLITDDDYRSLFRSRSPLDVDTLRRLLSSVAALQPRVIGVDLDTSDSSFLSLRQFSDSLHRAGVPVIWAQDAISCVPEEDHADRPAANLPKDSACSPPGLHPSKVLGADVLPNDSSSGLAVAELDHYGTIRQYHPLLEVADGTRRPSFAWVLSRAYASHDGVLARDSISPRFIDFHPDSSSRQFSARGALTVARSPDRAKAFFGGRAVIIGSLYRSARDEHRTPLGIRPGLYIQAQTLETQLRGGGAATPSRVTLAGLQLIIGAVIVFMLLHLPLRRAAFSLFFAIPVLTLLGSWILTRSPWAGIIYFFPLLIVLLMHQLYEEAYYYRKRFVDEYQEMKPLGLATDSLTHAITRGVAAAQATGDQVNRLLRLVGNSLSGTTPKHDKPDAIAPNSEAPAAVVPVADGPMAPQAPTSTNATTPNHGPIAQSDKSALQKGPSEDTTIDTQSG